MMRRNRIDWVGVIAGWLLWLVDAAYVWMLAWIFNPNVDSGTVWVAAGIFATLIREIGRKGKGIFS
jgi:hypothetical protein